MNGFLEQMARESTERVARARARLSDRELRARACASPLPPPLTLDPGGFDLIAEVKLRSPAAGRLANREQASVDHVVARAREYSHAGAAAVSVLTEPTRFDGSLEHLTSAASALQASGVPAMRKDFLVDPYQVLEARAAGAGGVLIVLRMLSDAAVESLLDCARDLDLFALLEAFDEADLQRAHQWAKARASGATFLVGLNCRDLDTLEVVPGRLESLAHQLPPGVPRVAESGVACAADAARVAAAGYDLALVGTALMRHDSPGAVARELLAAGRAARGEHAPSATDSLRPRKS
jgi:indole-3-glycerol phosphate synthase